MALAGTKEKVRKENTASGIFDAVFSFFGRNFITAVYFGPKASFFKEITDFKHGEISDSHT